MYSNKGKCNYILQRTMQKLILLRTQKKIKTPTNGRNGSQKFLNPECNEIFPVMELRRVREKVLKICLKNKLNEKEPIRQ